eukprot:UN20739
MIPFSSHIIHYVRIAFTPYYIFSHSHQIFSEKMSKIDSKPNFLVTFLSSTSRKRMWTYNFLTKNECFSTFSSFYCLGKANELLSRINELNCLAELMS